MDLLNAIRMALLTQEPLPLEWRKQPKAMGGPLAWPAANTLPPGHPRKFVGPDGRVFAAEEPQPVDDSSPSDAGPGGAAPPPAAAIAPQFRPRLPSAAPAAAPPVAAAPDSPPSPGDDAMLRMLVESRRNPRFFGPGGMREEFAPREQAAPQAAPDADWMGQRLQALGVGSPAELLQRVERENAEKPTPLSTEDAVWKGWLKSGLGPDEAHAKTAAWRATMAQNAAKDRERFANLPEAGRRLDEHRLFKYSPRLWAMWRMVDGKGGGAGGGDVSGMMETPEGLIKLAALNEQMGFPGGANKALEAGKILAEARHGQGQLDLAGRQQEAAAAGDWQQRELQRQAEVGKLSQDVRRELIARSGDPKYVPSQEAVTAELERQGYGALMTPLPRPGGGGPGKAPVAAPGKVGPVAPGITPFGDSLRQQISKMSLNDLQEMVSGKVDDLYAMTDEDITALGVLPKMRVARALVKAYQEGGWGAFGGAAARRAKITKVLERFGVPATLLPKGRAEGPVDRIGNWIGSWFD